ncbi:hypothetical protein RM780_09595 [Streptomyces sp. DSM 44917]|uniref:Uncharacterized protein n=1 Tax=Streptomyces boetiae TaxID=3075541 RepID=A0ABU2L6S0_9ACTN|nr:hypothetical protein [Streptomyces sp. DSM 44917]MDT0307215.1 hypothetical protein [Streptomyces sp. DSM 44917]
MTEGAEHPRPPAHAHTPVGAVRRRRIRRRAATVWTLPQPPATAPSASLPGWLEAAVRRIATTYTRRGDRILLLAPPEPDTRHAHTGHAPEAALPRLASAARALARQDRQAQVRTLAAATPPADSTTPEPAQESGPRLLLPPPPETGPDRSGPADRRSGRARHRPQSADRTAGVGRPVGTDGYDLVIICLPPDAAGWTASAPWSRLLSPHGTLTIVTQSGEMQGLHDGNLHLLEHMAGLGGLALLDRIALLAAPVTAASSALGPPPGAARGHTELLVLARPGAAGEPGAAAAGTGVSQ